MNVLRFTESGFAQKLRAMAQGSSLFDPQIEGRTRAIVDDVRLRGDQALLEFTERFDGATLTPSQLAVTQAEFMAAALKADQALRDAIALASKNVRMFSRRSLRRGWRASNAQGGVVGEKFDPFQRVGIYIPGGTAPLVSTAIMTVTLAKEAGCRDIVVCTPCGRDGSVNPALLHAVRVSGATEVYRLGGAQAIAAMALGTASIPFVQKIYGPGNAYVVAAKRLLFGHVAIDLLPGPSEVMVIADESADPRFVAADLLAQAEHGSGHERVWLVTPSGPLITQVQKEISRQMPSLARRDFISKALAAHGWLIQVESLEDAAVVANAFAPEHCEIMTRKPEVVAESITTAGAIFLGPYSPTVLGDYVAGPSHELPTGGAGHSFAGLTVDQFQRRTSVVRYDRGALQRSLKAVEAFAAVEGLGAHGRSASIRLEKAGAAPRKRTVRR